MRRRLTALALGAALIAVEGVAADFTVVQKARAFSLRQLTIKAGDQVTFTNEDGVSHNVYSETKGAEFDFVQRPGAANAVRFSQPGLVEVQCAIHPVMKLQVQVAP